MAVGSFLRADKAIRDGKGRILGMRKRTPAEIVAHILANSVRDKKTGCLNCRLRPDQKGYPRIGKRTRVHNAVFFNGVVPPAPRVQVLHSCDNRVCVERSHLYAGTNKQNIADKVSRDRLGKYLTTDRIRRIKTMLARGITYDEVVRLSGLAQSVVASIADGRRGRLIAHSLDPVVEIPSGTVT